MYTYRLNFETLTRNHEMLLSHIDLSNLLELNVLIIKKCVHEYFVIWVILYRFIVCIIGISKLGLNREDVSHLLWFKYSNQVEFESNCLFELSMSTNGDLKS